MLCQLALTFCCPLVAVDRSSIKVKHDQYNYANVQVLCFTMNGPHEAVKVENRSFWPKRQENIPFCGRKQ